VHPDDRQRADEEWEQAVAKGLVYASEIRVFHGQSSSYRWTSVRAVPLEAADGSVRGWVGMHSDITEQREGEEALRDADRRKDEFLAMLGHELRNPLAAIRSAVEVRAAAKAGENSDDGYWAVIDRQSGHMARLINDLLDIVRLEHGKLRLRRDTIDLGACVGGVVRDMTKHCESNGVALESRLSNEPVLVDADPERIIQIIENLLQNAISFTGSGGEIHVSVQAENQRAVVRVRDSGIGIDPEDLPGLFEPYRQVDPGKRTSGLGLGLTLVKRLVEQHDGTIEARSQGRGHGSEFCVVLPLVASKQTRAEPLARRMPVRRRILVVDDDADVAQMFAHLLEMFGQDVRVANSGRDAIESVRSYPPEIAFLDLSMPVMSGEELAQRLRVEIPDGLHLVALSGFAVGSRKATGDFDSHLLKPATAGAIIDFLNSLPAAADPR
jgi:signal transduction histidine kinase/CheY-like chemotaxis protein